MNPSGRAALLALGLALGVGFRGAQAWGWEPPQDFLEIEDGQDAEDAMVAGEISRDQAEDLAQDLARSRLGGTGGEIWHESVLQSEDAGADRSGAMTWASDVTRIRQWGWRGRFDGGAVLRRGALALPDRYQDRGALTVRDEVRTRWTKGYLSYRAAVEAGKPDWLRQVVAGHFRAGFFESAASRLREKSSEFYGDDRLNEPRDALIAGRPRQSPPLRGFAAQLGGPRLNYSAFYSQDRYPGRAPEAREDGTVSIRTVDDLLSMEALGGCLAYQPDPELRLAAFWARDRIRFDAADFARGFLNLTLWGLDHRNQAGRVFYRALFARADRPVAGLEDRDFWFLAARADLSEEARLWLFYKDIGPGFLNPVDGIYQDDLRRAWTLRALRRFSPGLGALVQYEQGEREDGGPYRRAEAQARGRPAPDTELLLKLGFEAYEPAPAPVASARMLLGSQTQRLRPDRLRSGARLTFRPSRRVEARLDASLQRVGSGSSAIPGESAGCRLIIHLSDRLRLRGEAVYTDADADQPGKEAQVFRLEARWGISRGWEARLRWQNRFLAGDAGEPPPGSRDVLDLRLIWRW